MTNPEDPPRPASRPNPTRVNSERLTADFAELLQSAADELGLDFKTGARGVAAYMAERSEHLSKITHEPGFAEAVEREVLNVAAEAGIEAHDAAKAADQKVAGIIVAGLRIAALALV